MVGRVVDPADAEIGLACRLGIAIDKDILGAAIAWRPEEARLLAAEFERRTVGIGAIRHRHGRIVLLDAALHFREQVLPQRLGVGHQRGLIAVLGLEVGADIRVQNGGVAKHLLPVLRPQPGIFIRPGHAVTAIPQRATGGEGRRDGRENGFVLHRDYFVDVD